MENLPAAGPDGFVRLQDPRHIRALAHPARTAIIDALASGAELTATECAQLTDLSPSATAYHLKLLERYGYAERAAARTDGRERPWRAADRGVQADLDTSTPAGAAAAAAVSGAVFDGTRAIAETFIRSEHAEPAEWRHTAILATADLWLDAAEAAAVRDAFAAALEPYRGRTVSTLPAGARRVRVMNVITPYRAGSGGWR